MNPPFLEPAEVTEEDEVPWADDYTYPEPGGEET